jgi:hypothetical protein
MTPTLPRRVAIVEVGPRDGLQNEPSPITTDMRIELCDRLTDAGFPNIEAGSFVSPKWVPQMADTAELMRRIRRKPGVTYSVLTPNMKGFEGALEAKADEVVIFGAASEAFSQRNINCSIAESIARFEPVAQAAKANRIRLRASVSVALGCPYQGEVSPAAVADVEPRFADLGDPRSGLRPPTRAEGACTFDTWSTHYESNGVNDDVVLGDTITDQAADGLDNDTRDSSGAVVSANGFIDDRAEMETLPPYSAALRGIEIRLRCYEPSSRQVRQVTIRHSFVPR